MTIDALFEAARTHLDLATLGDCRGDHATASTHLAEARATFVSLRLPKYVERAEQLAATLGIALMAGPRC